MNAINRITSPQLAKALGCLTQFTVRKAERLVWNKKI